MDEMKLRLIMRNGPGAQASGPFAFYFTVIWMVWLNALP